MLQTLFRLATGLSTVFLTGFLTGQEPATQPPNIVLIVTDDLGYGDLGCYGQEILETPRIDALAAAGRRYTDFYAGSTVCAPSRCALITGMHTGRCEIRGNSKQALSADAVTLAEVLKTRGYTCGAFGKWGIGGEKTTGLPTRQGFDRFYGYLDQHHAHNYYPSFLIDNEQRVSLPNVVPREGKWGQGVAIQKRTYSHDLIVEQSFLWLDKAAKRDAPFFLYLPWTLPHANNEAGKKGMEVPDQGPFATKDWPEPERGFAAMLARIDRDVGAVLDRLDALGVADNTLVIFTSDNGPHNEGGHKAAFFKSSGPLKGTKRSLHEGGIRVPFIARWPGKIEAGSSSSRPSAFWDLMPTFADLAGTKSPSGIQGVSFAGDLCGQAAQQASTLFWAFYEGRGGVAVRFGKWKAIQQPKHSEIRLYNLETDLGETKNLAKSQPEQVEAAKRRLEASYQASAQWRFRKPKQSTPKNADQKKAQKQQPVAKAKQPNIVLVYTDDLGWADVGYQGDRFNETPNIDSFARQNMIFSHAYSNGPNCAPSRASLMTGCYTPRHGIITVGSSARGKAKHRKLIPVTNRTILREEEITLAETLQSVGYVTATFGKWHLGPDPKTQGFAQNVGGTTRGHPKSYFSPYKNPALSDGEPGEHLTERLTDEALAFIRSNQKKPFFLYLPYFAVHTPIQAPKKLTDYYKQKRGQHAEFAGRNPKYAAMLHSVDEGFGRILETLKELKLADNTVVIFTSDNGGHGPVTRKGVLRGAKGMLYEGGIRVPLALRWPGVSRPGTISDVPVIGSDLFATLATAGRASSDLGNSARDSVDLRPLIEADHSEKERSRKPATEDNAWTREALYWHFPAYLQAGRGAKSPWRTTPAGALRQGEYKLIEFFEDMRIELYDLTTDPTETHDLSHERPALAAELKSRLHAWRVTIGAEMPIPK